MYGTTHSIDEYLERFQAELDAIDRSEVQHVADLLYNAWEEERFIYVFGNGGSGATASHFAEDLGKNALRELDSQDDRKKRPRVISLSDNTSWITAIGNDLDFEQIFVQQLMQYGRAGDLVVAISGSGNSRNVLNAVDWANRQGLVTIGLTGFDGGRLRERQRHGLHAPTQDMGMVESVHLAVLHWVVEEIHARVNCVGRYA